MRWLCARWWSHFLLVLYCVQHGFMPSVSTVLDDEENDRDVGGVDGLASSPRVSWRGSKNVEELEEYFESASETADWDNNRGALFVLLHHAHTYTQDTVTFWSPVCVRACVYVCAFWFWSPVERRALGS
jgi:hypothetical protein